jgi:diguanylate cyclase (GGDEF)-like protein/PAS domain S-box-containing protein
MISAAEGSHRSTGTMALTAPLNISAEQLLHGTADVLAVILADGSLGFVSGAIEQLIGVPPEAVIGLPITDVVHPDDLPRVLERLAVVLNGGPVALNYLRITDTRGGWVPVELTARTMLSDNSEMPTSLVVSLRDASERQQLLDQLRWQATHDRLTGLLSLDGLHEVIEDPTFCLADCMTVLRIDADGFQRINEFYGHRFGDSVMARLGSRLTNAVGENAIIARLGGDDFLAIIPCEVLAPSISPEEDRTVTERLIQVAVHALIADLESPDEVDVELGFRVGVAHLYDSANVLVAIAEAEAALRYAKSTNHIVATFDESMRRRSERRRSVESSLRAELQQPTNITLDYQPILDAVTRRVVSFEGLARWAPPGEERVSPGEFIPVAEAAGLMSPLTTHVMTTAVRQLAAWKELGLTSSTISFNAPVSQIQRADFAPRLEQLLKAHGVNPVEITESNMIERLETARDTLETIRQLGCSVAIDDFGTGYSSFGWLRDLPVDYIKLDRTFVAPLSEDSSVVHIVRSMIDLCSRLGFCVVAEGVETQTQADMLTALGVDRLQGFLFSPAVPPSKATELTGHRFHSPSQQP